MKDEILAKIQECSSKKGPPGLSRMRRLLSLLGNPERDLGVIHIGGTNGKGSVSRYIYSILRSAGISTGLFTSPHVMRYNERFEVDGDPISDADFSRLAEIVMDQADLLNREGYGNPSQFEILTAVAFLFFSESNTKIAIIEVGIGGRYDCTNAVDAPLISIITQVGYDHTEILGPEISDITYQKSGIIKPGTPVVSTSPESEVRRVIYDVCDENGSKLFDTSLTECTSKYTYEGMIFDTTIDGIVYNGLKIGMFGKHQIQNAIAAIAAIHILRETVPDLNGISTDDIRSGLMVAKNMGRFEYLSHDPDLIIDAAHNTAGIRAALSTLGDLYGEKDEIPDICVVFACFRDKQYKDMIDDICSMSCARSLSDAKRIYIATEPVSPRALSSGEAADLIRGNGMRCIEEKDIGRAYDVAMSQNCDVTIFLGSIYMIGDARIIFNEKGWNTNV